MSGLLLALFLGSTISVRVAEGEKPLMSRVRIVDGQPVSFTEEVWSSYTFWEGNGVAIDVWNLSTELTCISCEFRLLVHGQMAEYGGIVHCEQGNVFLDKCLFWYCTCQTRGILHFGHGPNHIEVRNCTMYDCKTWRPGAMIYFITEKATQNELVVTGCNMSLCKVCQWNANTNSAPVT